VLSQETVVGCVVAKV